jgi:hypothetical protein
MCIKYVLWRKIFNKRKAILLSFGVVVALFVFNFHLNFTIEYSINENKTIIDMILSSNTILFWLNVSLFSNFLLNHLELSFLSIK